MNHFKRGCCLFSLTLFAFNYTQAQSPTWSNDAACIIYSHCTSCHNPNGAGPMSLLTYDDVKVNSNSIKFYVKNELMPPWPVDNSYSKIAHTRNLSNEEKSTLLKWIDEGLILGDTNKAPTEPVYNSMEIISNPDMVLKAPTYTVPVITEDLYRCFVIPTGQTQNKFITGLEIIPGNKNIVHHVQVFYDTSGICQNLDQNDPQPGYTSAGGVGTDKAVLLGTWVPGSSPIFLPSGMGKNLPANAKIVVQIHYPEYSSGQTDSTKMNFILTRSALRNIFDAPILNHFANMTNGPLFIPKNTVKTFNEEFTLPGIDITLLNIGPHGHLLCTKMNAYAVTPTGDTIPLINIPEWDFHWQGSYDFQRPIKIPAGSKLFGEATYDNTTNNEDNPSNPPQDVRVGESTTDEMMLFYFSFALYNSGDENIVIDTLSSLHNHDNCIPKTNWIGAFKSNQIILAHPNPANSSITVVLENNKPFELNLYNSSGQKCISQYYNKTISTKNLPAGIYLLSINQRGVILTKKIKIEHR